MLTAWMPYFTFTMLEPELELYGPLTDQGAVAKEYEIEGRYN